MRRIIAISNQKGGVGKTTTAINLASALALMRRKVLLIDLDPQGNASSGLGVPKATAQIGISDVLMDYMPAASAIHPIPRIPNLHLIPATRELIGLTVELINAHRREFRLKDALRKLDQSYDYILIDCPPALNQLTLNALTAAHGVLVPLQAEYFALEGIGDLLQTIHQIRKGLNPDLALTGVVMTMVNMGTCLSQEVVSQAQGFFGSGFVFKTMAKRSIQYSEASSHGQPIHLYAPGSQGAEAYSQMARELLSRDGSLSGEDSSVPFKQLSLPYG
jgi:chromosome partitioning protein